MGGMQSPSGWTEIIEILPLISPHNSQTSQLLAHKFAVVNLAISQRQLHQRQFQKIFKIWNIIDF
jgi:hypothetical protein